MIPLPIVIVLSLVLIVIGAILTSEFSEKIGSFLMILGLSIGLYIFFDKPIVENSIEGYYNINTVTNKEVTTQICVVNDKIMNITDISGSIFPEGTIAQRNQKSYKVKRIIDWCKNDEYSYEYVLSSDKKYNEILKERN